MDALPSTMRSLTIPKYCKPDKYELTQQPTPVIQKPTDVLIRVHAAAISTGDTQRAAGMTRLAETIDFPLKIGIEFSGSVVAVGEAVTSVDPGDDVFGAFMQPGEISAPGFVSEFAIAPESFVMHKPSFLSHTAAASLTASLVTAIQSFNRALALLPPPHSLKGRTVFVPAALSGTGSIGCQLAKYVYDAGKVITTVSTAKVPHVDEYLGHGTVDQIIDYKTQNILKEVPLGSVDFLYNTQWQMTLLIPLVNPETGVIVSIASYPPSSTVKKLIPSLPLWVGWVLDVIGLWYSWKLWGNGLKYEYLSGNPSVRSDLEKAGELIRQGKIKAVVGSVVGLEDLEGVRKGCWEVYRGKGGVGKFVIKIA